MQNNSRQKTTHFGYEAISAEEKNRRIDEDVYLDAQKYDLMNDLMSLGMHRLWKRFAIELSGVRQGQKILDVAGGTGDLAMRLSRITGSNGLVVLADINDAMLQVGRNRLLDRGFASAIQYVQTNAEQLPFPDNSFHCITLSFGLRTITDKNRALQEIHRVLQPGGRLLILEFSKPTHPLLNKMIEGYSSFLLPQLGQWIEQDQKTLRHKMQKIGFCRCDYHNLTGGIVALHRGFKA